MNARGALARDFDPHSLRRTIPGAVQSLSQALSSNGRWVARRGAGAGPVARSRSTVGRVAGSMASVYARCTVPARACPPACPLKTPPPPPLTRDLPRCRRVYVHCTAGLGRAPAVCIAYMYWFGGMQLDEAYEFLTKIRPCGPKRDAIRGATYDVVAGSSSGVPHGGHSGHSSSEHLFSAFDSLDKNAYATLSEGDRFALQYRVLKGLC
ncbi:Phosphoglucan phosphatase LSF2, chloroplastic [Tetrabaena socialis]|uniref:Phosphoglucan phosphatase LSF2, chloroplastic n=1 Tax=Tetrabaena socialis TaxID=47790 RepID=A0A2J8ABL9_9CHLO|nr:Phosphoglucan phosphatase LSF2, chloroplastic [Tetrabaena socialis]|eukprot:PNH09919.1 Phosphoglucan phosphatase LSF2, chloroplastic [Tetrabaena socialis]